MLFEFGPELGFGCGTVRWHDVAADGGRFYVTREHPAAPPPPVTHVNIILNWFEELKAKLPVR